MTPLQDQGWAQRTWRGESGTVAMCTAVGPGTGTHEGLDAHALLEPQNGGKADAHALLEPQNAVRADAPAHIKD